MCLFLGHDFGHFHWSPSAGNYQECVHCNTIKRRPDLDQIDMRELVAELSSTTQEPSE
jgi:hypothetical protein